jgi:CBS domain-containing protein
MARTAKEIMTSKLVTVSPDDTIAKAVAKMDQYDVKELPIVNHNSQLIGMITYYDILDSPRVDADAKVSSLSIMPATAKSDTPVTEIATMMLNTGIEAVPILKDGKVIGIISDFDILRESANDPKLKKLKAKEVMSDPPKQLRGDEPISTARRIMRYNNVDRLPVVTEDGRALGMVLSMDILRAFYRAPTEKMGRRDRAGRSRNPLLTPVKGFMRTDIPEVNMDEPVSSVIKRMLNKKLRGTYVLNHNDRIVGLVSRFDILDRLVGKKFEEGVWLNFSGAPIPYDQVETVKNYISTNVKKLKYYLPALISVDIHIKKIHAATPEKWNYEVNVSLEKGAGPKITARARYGYNLMFTVDDVIQRLLKMLERKYKEREGKPYS